MMAVLPRIAVFLLFLLACTVESRNKEFNNHLPSEVEELTHGANKKNQDHESAGTKLVVNLPPPPTPSSPPSFLKLVLQWPKSLCKTKDVCALVPGFFTIHGLWASKDIGCGTVTYKDSLLDPLRAELKEYWVDAEASTATIYKGSPKAFWKHEWETHGPCTYLRSQVDYFSRSLHVYKYMNNVTDIMYKNFPSSIPNHQALDAILLWRAINSGLGTTVDMMCTTSKSGKQVLKEIKIPVDTSKWEVATGQKSGKNKCRVPKLYIPT